MRILIGYEDYYGQKVTILCFDAYAYAYAIMPIKYL